MSAILFKDFTFKYDNLKQPTLKNINLRIENGEKVLIAGPSGSGKSTLAHCINGLIPFTYKGSMSGSIEICGVKPYEKSLYEISSFVGTILQDQDGQFVGLSVGEDVAFAYENNKVPCDEMHRGTKAALQKVDMEEFIGETPHNLSGGQKQKVSIVGILATDTEILIFDEPLANLDPVSGRRAMEIINDIHANTGKTVVIIEHRIEDVLEHGFDRIVIINDGEIVADGHPDDILPSNVLPSYGLREPLYIEFLKRSGVKISPEDKVSKLDNITKFKEAVLSSREKETMEEIASQYDTLLSLEGICYKYYKDTPYTVKNITFDIKAGEVLAILGNNGAGKSTLLKVLSGIARHQEGTIRYKGERIDDWTVKKRSGIIGYVMQNPNHMITKSMVFDEVAFGLRNLGNSEEVVSGRVEEALRICGLYPYRRWPVSSLSYGQKKRVTIASILAMQPEVIVLDEPTAGQDHRTYMEFMQYLENIKSSGISIIMITHDIHLALEYADRAVVISGGEIIADASVYKVLSQESVIERANLKETSISRMARMYGIEDIESFLAYGVRCLKGGALDE